MAAWQGAAGRMSISRWSPSSPAITASSRRASRLFPPPSPRRWSPISQPAARRSTRSARLSTFRLKVYELALEQPTGDITQEPALDEGAARRPWPSAWRRWPAAPDLLVLGEMGIGNTTVAAAIYHALYGGEPEDWVGRGTGVDDAGLKRKADAVRAAVARHEAHLGDPARSPAPPRRPRNRRDGGRHSRRAHAAHAGDARRLRRLLGGGGRCTRSTERARPLPGRAMSRPRKRARAHV